MDSGDGGADSDGKVFEGIYYHFYSSDCIHAHDDDLIDDDKAIKYLPMIKLQ